MRYRKLPYVFICFILLISASVILSSCNVKNDVPDPAVSSSETSTETDGESSTDIADDNGLIKVEKMKDFRLVRPQSAGDELIKAATDFYKSITSEYSITMDFRDDFTRNDVDTLKEAEYEILIGYCDRDECREAYKDVKDKDYIFTLVGTKLIIGGKNDESTIKALEAFTEKIVSGADKNNASVFFDNVKDSFRYDAEYAVDELMINGTSVNEFAVVYPYQNKKFEKTLALQIADKISEVSGYVVEVKNDRDEYVSGKEIHVGITNRDAEFAKSVTLGENDYFIGKNTENFILIYSDTIPGNIEAVGAFISRLRSEPTEKLEIDISDKTVGSFEVKDMSVMSFNILTTKPDEARINRVVTTVMNYLPDTVGMQEVSPYWMSVLRTKLGSAYSYVGEGRNGGNEGEYNTIFYNKEKFDLIESGTRWLSDTPEVKGSKHPTSSYPRIYTFAVLQRKSDGVRFIHVNTHFDHVSPEARIFQAEVLVEFLKQHSDYPLILTGDFNCLSNEKTYKIITSAGVSNAADVAAKKENVGETFHNFGSSSKIIDFCFENDHGIYIKYYKVVKDIINGAYPSDHYPIYVEYGIAGQ